MGRRARQCCSLFEALQPVDPAVAPHGVSGAGRRDALGLKGIEMKKRPAAMRLASRKRNRDITHRMSRCAR